MSRAQTILARPMRGEKSEYVGADYGACLRGQECRWAPYLNFFQFEDLAVATLTSKHCGNEAQPHGYAFRGRPGRRGV